MNHHHEHPELWFRPSPALSLETLSKLIETERITVTPRLGRRDGTHPKGYVPGRTATLRLHDDTRRELARKRIRITNVVSKPLREFIASGPGQVAHYDGNWQSIQRDLSFFEGRPVEPDDIVSLVEFSYLKERKE